MFDGVDSKYGLFILFGRGTIDLNFVVDVFREVLRGDERRLLAGGRGKYEFTGGVSFSEASCDGISFVGIACGRGWGLSQSKAGAENEWGNEATKYHELTPS